MENDAGAEAWYTLSGDVNDSMVRRVFDASAQMAQEGVQVAHLLLHSHGGYISDGLCLYNVLSASPVRFVMYNAGVVASIAVTLFLAGAAALRIGNGALHDPQVACVAQRRHRRR